MSTPVEGGLYTPCERFRKGKGWSQLRLAGKADVSVSCVRAIEHGEVAGISVGVLVAVSSALGVSACDLVPGLAMRLPLRARERPEGRSLRGLRLREAVKEWMVSRLRERGAMKVMELGAELYAEFGVSQQQVKAAREELGLMATRRKGMGNGRASWYVELPDSLKDAG